MFLSSVITKILAAIIALFMPFTSVAPAISTSVAAEANPALAKDAVAYWDVSNDLFDNVNMYYFEKDDKSFLDEINAAIHSVFAPITAFAAEEEEEIVPEQHTGGTVVVDGKGATGRFIFLNWLNANDFVDAYEDWYAGWYAENDYSIDEAYIAYGDIDEEGYYNDNSVSAAFVEAKYANYGDTRGEAILKEYFPALMCEMMVETPNFWKLYGKFIPEEIIVTGDVTKINFAAFAFCTKVTSITIGPNVEVIDGSAFTQAAITELVLPASVRIVGESAFEGCADLETIMIYGNLAEIGRYAFDEINEDSVIACKTVRTFYKIAGYDVDCDEVEIPENYGIMTTSELDGEANDAADDNLMYNYNYRTSVVFAPII